MKKSLLLAIVFFALCFVSIILGAIFDEGNITWLFLSLFLVFIAIGMFFFFRWSKIMQEENQRKLDALPEEEREKIELAKKQEQEKRANSTTVVRTRIIGQDSRKDIGSSVARGVVGGTLFGVAGAVGGAMSGKNKQSVIFYVTYKDGHSETKTVPIDSFEYKQYMICLER